MSSKKNGKQKRYNHYNDDGFFGGSEDDYEEYTESIPGNTSSIDLHFTPRDPSRKKARQEALEQRRAAYASERGTGAARSARSSSAAREKKSSYERIMMNNRTVMIAAAFVLLLVIVVASATVKALYTSKTMFSDGGENLDANMIQERLITSEQNRDKVTYFLIAGVDKSSMLTDCIWVMCFDNQAHQMNVMQIPRDTYVGSDSVFPHKVNAVYANPQTVDWCEKCNRAVTEEEIEKQKHTVCGTKITTRTESNMSALIRCINNRLSLPVDHYVLFDFAGFEKVIDALGGVDIYLEEEMKVYPNKYQYDVLPAGDNHLDGKMALKFMRNRKIYVEGDLGRVRAQRKIIHAMMEKVTNMSTLDALSVLTAAYGNFKTDMSLEEIRSFIAPVKKCDTDSLHMFEMPGTDHWVKPNPSYYVCNVQETVAAINEYMVPYSDPMTEEDIHFPMPQD